MADRTKKAFRSSVHGFKRKDVNEFILELSKRYSEIESEFREKIAALEAENKKLSSRLAVAEAELRAADAKAKAPEDKPVPEDAKKAAAALSEIKRMRSKLKKQVREIESKYGDVLPVPEKREKNESAPAETPKCTEIEEKPEPDKPSEHALSEEINVKKAEPAASVEEQEPAAGVEEPEPASSVEEPEPAAGGKEPESAAGGEEPESAAGGEEPEPAVGGEQPVPPSDDFETYLDEFRSSTAALFSEFDKKYGTKFSGGDDK